MTTTFMAAPSISLTSESVTEGHPDKMCDQISDAILDAIMAGDPMGRVACETAATTGLVVVMGEITTSTYVEMPTIVRDTVRDIGYTHAHYGFDYETCGVMVSVKDQSRDIAIGVNEGLEAREGHASADHLDTGAGDQGMMMGFACNETPQFMPLTISLAHRLCRQLAHVRKSGLLAYLRPDGKSQVTVEYEYGRPKRIDTVVISAQHDPDITAEALRSDIIEQVIRPILPEELLPRDPRMLTNPTGRFVIGGPTVSVMLAAKALGARDSRVLKYGDSGDVSGDKDAVVGYLAAAYERSRFGQKELTEDETERLESAWLTVRNRLLRRILRRGRQ